MKYQINKSNYHTFELYEVNKLAPRSYFIPYPDRETADSVSLREKRYRSPMVQCLNGDWDFRFYPRPAELPDVLDTEEIAWDCLDVPSCWQFRGYDKPFYVNLRYQFPYNPPEIPKEEKVGKVFSIMGNNSMGPGWTQPEEEYNFVGVYRKKITVEDPAKQYILSFLGVASCMDLYVNGKFVGYSEGAHNTAEFDISAYITEGENELLVVVHRWCNGTYLECQDMFRNNGIFRDVLLRVGDKKDIWDIDVKMDRLPEDHTSDESDKEEEKVPYRVTLRAEFFQEGSVKVTISGHGLSVTKEAVSKDHVAEVVFDRLDVAEWTAETPNLYDVYFETETECIKCRIGFKKITIDGRKFLWNGRLVKFHGVNHHDTSCTNGYTMTPEEMERDVQRCKEFNIDTVRTSHYPPDPYFLELCDEAGIYIVDEADLETHGVFVHKLPPSYNHISHDPAWETHYVDRVKRLYQRDKLHPSIMLWSLGNEAGGYANQDKMYEYLKERTDIPVHYESVIHSKRKAYDVGSEMYPSVEHVHAIGEGKWKEKKLNDRPYFLCEYVHAMGVGPGNMEAYWKEIYTHDSLMGGCIWEMVDHAVLHEDGSYTYGGDHGEWEHDGNFCVDGIFYPDRTPSTGAKIARFVYRPLRVSREADGRFCIFNTRSFTDGNRYQLNFQWSDGGKAQLIPQVAPLSTVMYTVTPEPRDEMAEKKPEDEMTANRCSWVTVTTVDRTTGEEVAKEQIMLREMAELPVTVQKTLPEEVHLSMDGFCLDLPEGMVMAQGEPFTSLYRVSTDNDRSLTGQKPMEAFMGAKEEILHADYVDGAVTITSRLTCKKHTFLCRDTYEGCAEGLLVTSTIHCEKGKGHLPRFGKTFCLDKSFDQVIYLGRNGESYADMKDQAPIETVHCSVRDMTEPNIRPQESGNRMDCQYVILSDGEHQVQFSAVNRPFELSVKPYSDAELSRMTHREDEQCSGTYVTIEAFQMGIGTGSCGPATTEEFCYDVKKDYEVKYLISWK